MQHRFYMKKPLVLLLLLATVFSFGQETEKGRFAKIDSLMNYLYANGKFMGSIALREKDKVVFSKAYGYSDVEHETKATPQTKYKIGSITKTFTACVIFQLVEEKKLKLESKLSEFFPKIKNADKITIAQMLGHSSGIYNYTTDSTFVFTSQMFRRDMLERLYSYNAAFEPGTKAEYSNSNYILLGYIIQDVTHKSYKENVTTRVIKKVGLKNTYYYGKINPKKKEAYSYSYETGAWERVPEWHESIAGAAGALESTPEDLTQFITALFNNKIVSAESLALMSLLDNGYGKGLVNFPFGERKFFGHNGGIEGFTSTVGYYPKENFAVAMITNGLDFDFNEIMMGVLSSYYKLPYRFPSFNAITLDDAILKKYEGNYTTKDLPFTINVTLVKGQLRVHADEQGTFYIAPVSETEFIHDASGVKMTFSPTGFTLEQNGTSTFFKKQ